MHFSIVVGNRFILLFLSFKHLGAGVEVFHCDSLLLGELLETVDCLAIVQLLLERTSVVGLSHSDMPVDGGGVSLISLVLRNECFWIVALHVWRQSLMHGPLHPLLNVGQLLVLHLGAWLDDRIVVVLRYVAVSHMLHLIPLLPVAPPVEVRDGLALPNS